MSDKKKWFDVGLNSMYISDGNGQIALQCPHCGRWLMVDIDDYLPVHSRNLQMRMKDAPPEPEPLNSLCAGSYNTKGVKGNAV